MAHYPNLYKRTANGKIEVWSVWTEGADVVTEYGHLGGKLQRARETAAAKCVGMSNERDALTQAEVQAHSAWREKRARKGYVETLAEAEAGLNGGAGGIRPMLAQPFSKHGDKVEFPCFAQPKLDGIRCIAVVGDAGDVTLWSREQKPILSVPHVAEAVRGLSLKPGTVLDGELYNHELRNDFERIVSAVRKQKAVDAEAAERIQYHVYDAPSGESFGSRYYWLQVALYNVSSTPLRLVDTWSISNRTALMDAFNICRLRGYEGCMVRCDAPYEVGKRSYHLQKLKEFDESEFPIVGVEEGVGKMSGLAIFVCRTEGGSEFRCKLEGALEDLKRYLQDESTWRGKRLTVKYQGLTGKAGVPRFPVGKAVRDYE